MANIGNHPFRTPLDELRNQTLTSATQELLKPILASIEQIETKTQMRSDFQLWEERLYLQNRTLRTEDEIDGDIKSFIARYLDDERAVEALVTLGATYRDTNYGSEGAVAFKELRTFVKSKSSRAMRKVLNEALAVVTHLPKLSRHEIVKALEKNFEGLVEGLGTRVITTAEVESRIKRFALLVPNQVETDLLIGVSILQTVYLLETPEMLTAGSEHSKQVQLSSGENLEDEDDNAVNRALFLLAMTNNDVGETGYEMLDKIIDAYVESYPFPRRVLRRSKKKDDLGDDISDIVTLASSINAFYGINQDEQKKSREIMMAIYQDDLEKRCVEILQGTKTLVDDMGRRITADPSQELMFEALVLDAFKDQVVNLVRNMTSAFTTDREHKAEISSGIEQLASYSLQTDLASHQSQLDEEHERDVFTTLVALAEERRQRYGINNTQLRKLDPGWQFMRSVHETFADIYNKDEAKEMCKFIMALAIMPSEKDGRGDIFDRLLLDIDAERHDNVALRGIPARIRKTEKGTHFEPCAKWMFENAEKLLALDNVPDSVKNMLSDLVAYKQKLLGSENTLDAIQEEVTEELLQEEALEPAPTQPIPTPPLPAPTPAPNPLDDVVEPSFVNIADQLDWVVFPDGVGLGLIKRMIEDRVGKDNTRVNWDRLQHLVDLTDKYGGRIYISKEKTTLGSTIPYLVAEFDIHEQRLAVAECPEIGNATYVVRNDLAAGTWQEVMRLSRGEARELGAIRIIHPTEDDHLDRIVKALNKVLVTQPVAGTSSPQQQPVGNR